MYEAHSLCAGPLFCFVRVSCFVSDRQDWSLFSDLFTRLYSFSRYFAAIMCVYDQGVYLSNEDVYLMKVS